MEGELNFVIFVWSVNEYILMKITVVFDSIL